MAAYIRGQEGVLPVESDRSSQSVWGYGWPRQNKIPAAQGKKNLVKTMKHSSKYLNHIEYMS